MDNDITSTSLHSPVGDLTIFADAEAIIAVEWGWTPNKDSTPLLNETTRQIHEYFDGSRQDFELQLRPNGSAHQIKVWAAMRAVPYGETETYGEIANQTGSSAQAVGGACGQNPIPILIPCHRIIASDGKLGGYSGEGGVDTKRQLLILEGAIDQDLFIL